MENNIKKEIRQKVNSMSNEELLNHLLTLTIKVYGNDIVSQEEIYDCEYSYKNLRLRLYKCDFLNSGDE